MHAEGWCAGLEDVAKRATAAKTEQPVQWPPPPGKGLHAHAGVAGNADGDEASGGGHPANLGKRLPELGIMFQRGIGENGSEPAVGKAAHVIGVALDDLVAVAGMASVQIQPNSRPDGSQGIEAEQAVRAGDGADFKDRAVEVSLATNLLKNPVDGWVHVPLP